MLGDSNQRLLVLLQCFKPTRLIGGAILRFPAKFCYLIQTMRLMVESYARQLFFCFFFKKIKRLAPREK